MRRHRSNESKNNKRDIILLSIFIPYFPIWHCVYQLTLPKVHTNNYLYSCDKLSQTNHYHIIYVRWHLSHEPYIVVGIENKINPSFQDASRVTFSHFDTTCVFFFFFLWFLSVQTVPTVAFFLSLFSPRPIVITSSTNQRYFF